jgi:hypothetical protein
MKEQNTMNAQFSVLCVFIGLVLGTCIGNSNKANNIQNQNKEIIQLLKEQNKILIEKSK